MVKNLRRIREKYGMTQRELGDLIGKDQKIISKYENERIEPDIETLKAMAKVLNSTIDYLVGIEEENHKEALLINGEPLTPKEANHIIEYRKLDVKTRKSYDNILEKMSQQQDKNSK